MWSKYASRCPFQITIMMSLIAKLERDVQLQQIINIV